MYHVASAPKLISWNVPFGQNYIFHVLRIMLKNIFHALY